MDERKIIEGYSNRPKTVAGEEFEAEVQFTRHPKGLGASRADLFGLEIGNTLVARGEFVKPNVPDDLSSSARFFAPAEVADWLEEVEVEEEKVYSVRLRCLFEVDVESEFTGEGVTARKRGRKGLLILSGGEK